ncbi:uncharacterized protein TRUGW13939_07057 [Talaromyces rugulosus]|uniref:Uncharacterized protein n=1 Tax=Talaromyces rugulosus TaxID=121627 RepID=A0A7H8R2H7_TALRU|nr:uncharacterized protein TRUGW13939_07057 [Talaromyces rugulosus]QKX59915.1 hypothetical protein TRUGW13939_07057 [Talaromyces rugulosus]
MDIDEGRSIPTANDYKDHQVRQEQEADTEIGGCYKMVEPLPAYPEGPTRLKEKNTWHGSPVASLRRAFHALGSPRIKTALTTTEIANLRTLMDLYFEPTTVDDQSSETTGESGPTATSEKRKHDDEDDEDESTDRKGKGVSSKKVKYEQDTPTPKYNICARYQEVPGKTWCPDFHYWVNASWQFGPEDIIEKASMFQVATQKHRG